MLGLNKSGSGPMANRRKEVKMHTCWTTLPEPMLAALKLKYRHASIATALREAVAATVKRQLAKVEAQRAAEQDVAA